DITQRTMFEVLNQSEIPYRFNRTENRLTLMDTGSEILFRSADGPDRLRGTNLAWFGVDELTYCAETAWLRLLGRFRHPKATELCGFACWTPKGYDWVYERFISNPGTDHAAIIAVPGENKALAPGFYESLARAYDIRFYEQEVLGKYLN